MPLIPEPPDGTRIEFEHWTDVYGAWKNVASSVCAGWRPDQCWMVYGGRSVPCTWDELIGEFSEDSIAGATVLAPVGVMLDHVPEAYTDEGRDQWLDVRDRFGVVMGDPPGMVLSKEQRS